MEDVAELDVIARAYVRLVLAIGEHDADYVDAYYGPVELREAVRSATPSLDELVARAESLVAAVESMPTEGIGGVVRLRRDYLVAQIRAVAARVGILRGTDLGFDDEAEALYDARPPSWPDQHFAELIAELDGLLQGTGPVVQRYAAFRDGYVVPPDRLDAVFRAAVDEARERTQRHLELPEGESFAIEYVTGRSWSGYNWYQGATRA